MTKTTKDALRARARGLSLGVFAADLGDLRAAARDAVGWGGAALHFDIMDGVFVPAMIGGPGFVQALDEGALRDVHLLLANPARHVAAYVAAGADIITVHAEAAGAAEALVAINAAARAAGRPVLAGLALMPGTADEAVRPLLDLQPDLLLVLALDPRTGTPPDITAAGARLSALRRLCAGFAPLMAFDGGVTLDSIDEIHACRPDMIVSGSAVFRARDPQSAFQAMTRSL